MKKIFLSLIALSALILASCTTSDPNSLKISVYLGGYGQVWINTLARQFEAENPGVTVTVEANPDLASDIPNRLQNGSNDDIFFSHGINWEFLAVQGHIEPLDDLMEQEVEDGVLLKDKVDQSLLQTAKFGGKYYKLPWTNGVGGIVYNAKMFRENGWEVPETYDELVALSETIYNAKIKVDPTDLKPNAATIKPFVWSQETYYWDYLVFDWWAQINGTDFFEGYKKAESSEIFNPETNQGHYKALEAWTNLVAKNPLYSVEDSVGKQYMAAQMDFLNGYAAMIPNAQWLESEMISNINPDIMEMRMMPAPFVAGAKTDNEGNPIRVNYTVGAGDSIIIPKKAPNKELAKKFLLFLAKDESIATFTEKTNGVLLAMNYDTVELDSSNLSEFSKSIIEINQNSQKFNLYSNSLMILEGKVGLEWPPQNLQYYATLFNHYNNRDYLTNPEGWLAAGNEYNVRNIFVESYDHIKANWSKWQSEIAG
ncbi:ABC transporter substrate-binding protein [Acholeplasma laidlawii]|uniref:ABC transporter substrate-binding protein n=1 Tax=Acholeplasma laidlawii TaxID=2148 RepID=UPI0021F782DD|nr:extracellular solute-binding protein [Acholeplasma laidlawii]